MIEEKTSMLFEFTRRDGAPTVFNDGTTFHVDQISRFGEGKNPTDVSHLIDRSYGYHSSRELRWHLAERFGHLRVHGGLGHGRGRLGRGGVVRAVEQRADLRPLGGLAHVFCVGRCE